MKAAQLNSRVHVLSAAQTFDAAGQPISAWTVTHSLWADVRYKTGLQQLHADRLEGGATVAIRVRQTSCSKTVSAGMRVAIGGEVVNGQVVGGHIYSISSTSPQGSYAIDWMAS